MPSKRNKNNAVIKTAVASMISRTLCVLTFQNFGMIR